MYLKYGDYTHCFEAGDLKIDRKPFTTFNTYYLTIEGELTDDTDKEPPKEPDAE
jgi:hypothetical protein